LRLWRLPAGPVSASPPNSLELDPGTVQRISRPFEQDAVAP